MPVQLQQETQDLIDTLLNDRDQEKRNEALRSIVTRPDKDQVEKYLLERFTRFNKETDRWRRTWSVSALAGIGLPDGARKVLECIADPPEADPWVRHFALIYVANFNPFPMAEIENATKDKEVLPKATALRLLLAHGEDQYADELLNMLQDANVPNARWAAARALRNRNEVKMKPLRGRIEERFSPIW
jgi:HEAT repeat protein